MTGHACSLLLALCSFWGSAQVTLRGRVVDAANGEPLFAAVVLEKGTTHGAQADFNGDFRLVVNTLPVVLVVQYLGYEKQEVNVTNAQQRLTIKLQPEVTEVAEVEITGERILDKQKQAPLTVESMDLIAIKECASGNFYEGLSNLKGVDMTTASLGFRIINTRGFNSTSPVRSLQLIDGVDNQSPGLNFSLGNFLGACELDLKNVEIVSGASSAFYGPGAFNGVIAMETKNPFFFPGVQASIKVGERSLFEPSARVAQVFKNKQGLDAVAFKICVYYMHANDWQATNYTPSSGSAHGEDNPGRFDAVNLYGDEFFPANNFNASPWNYRGIGTFYRTGYKEVDLVNYNTSNLKAAAAAHFRLKPEEGYESPELIYAANVGTGTTVYQGENRFALRDIFFMQNRLEVRKKEKYFFRIYETHEDAGRSYDPYATALRLLSEARSNENWSKVYVKYWNDSINSRINALGYPGLVVNPNWNPLDPDSPFYLPYDYNALNQWLAQYHDSLVTWHSLVEGWTNAGNGNIPGIAPDGYFEPGSPEFIEHFNALTSAKNNEGDGGTLFFDRSMLVHAHGEYRWQFNYLDDFRLGANGRMYRPFSDGTIFDDEERRITNKEFGVYTGATKKLWNDRLSLNATIRIDKNQNFNALISPAASAVYRTHENAYLRFSFSSALRNPTLTDQYLNLNVGPAILRGNLDGVDSLITLESFSKYRATLSPSVIRYFSIAPIRPEQVRTVELGYRTGIGNRLYLDAGTYFSIYNYFIGYNIGIKATFDSQNGLIDKLQVYRYSANSTNQVQTIGGAAGLNWYLGRHLTASGNYSYNKLVKTNEDDPIIPAFNTPLHKYNIGLSGRDFEVKSGSADTWGFNAVYKWVQGFRFEGSPQFTGPIPTYYQLDAQLNYYWDKAHTTFKAGASNLLNRMQIQAYGGPAIGRMAYFSVLYDINDF